MAQPITGGHAVYIEFTAIQDPTRIGQILVIGATAHEGAVVPYRLLARSLSQTSPNLQWRIDPVSEINPLIQVDTRGLSRGARPEAAVRLAQEEYAHIASTLDAMSSTTWTVNPTPLVLQVSSLDIADMSTGGVPRRLIDRLNRARTAAGFPALPSARR